MRLTRLTAAMVFAAALGLAGCTSDCDNAGVSVDGNGSIVVIGESGFVSPNSPILKNMSAWPSPPAGEQSLAFQGYALTRDGAGFYLLANTAEHPSLVYYIDLRNGRAAPIGTEGEDQGGAHAASKQTWLTAEGGYVYSVDQARPIVSRGNLVRSIKLAPFIAGSRTRLQSPIGVAVDRSGKVCALDSATLFVLCYASSARGNVAPEQSIDTTKILGYRQVDAVAFGPLGRLVVAGTSDSSGLRDFSIAAFDLTARAPRLLRTIAGPKTGLNMPDSIIIDGAGNALVLQADSNESDAVREVIAFGPRQRGDVAPSSVRHPATTLWNASSMAVDRRSGDVAILASDGLAYFPSAARHAPNRWPREVRLSIRGSSIAQSRGWLVVSDWLGNAVPYKVARLLKGTTLGSGIAGNLYNPDFVATDQSGRVYVASAIVGVITQLPANPAGTPKAGFPFRTPFGQDMNAFAADSSGYYYFSSGRNEAVIVVGPHGRQSLIRGGNTGLNNPNGLVVGADGTLYVANTDGKEILAFARGSSGNVAPAGRISGKSTGFVAPQALAVDAKGMLYVFDGPVTATGSQTHYVRVYDAGARGNVAPVKSYEVRTKCWVNAL